MTIERTEDEIIVRLPVTFDIDELQRMIDLLEYKSIVSKSKATQEQIDELSKDVSKSIWKKMVSERTTA
ncbi:MAG: hypothetical protein KIT33_12150 [Candidatus Kapabacteria bacterium]|nr:hypothetical protein [Ignavibacteriota bacterium]MCW5885712.1 hypothetical protein [Candidatus Kapabacteria bacterium]